MNIDEAIEESMKIHNCIQELFIKEKFSTAACITTMLTLCIQNYSIQPNTDLQMFMKMVIGIWKANEEAKNE